MTDAERVTVYLMSDQVRNYEIAFGGSGLARLYVEDFVDARGTRQSTARLHLDGEVGEDVVRAVIEAARAEVLAALPRGVCIVYRGHLVATFDYGA